MIKKIKFSKYMKQVNLIILNIIIWNMRVPIFYVIRRIDIFTKDYRHSNGTQLKCYVLCVYFFILLRLNYWIVASISKSFYK